MASATRLAHDFVAGETPSAATFDGLPGGWLGRAYNESDQTGITSGSGTVDVTGVTVSPTLNSTRRVLILVTGTVVETAASAVTVTGNVQEDGVSIGRWARGAIAASGTEMFTGWVETTSSAGSHTYKAQIAVASGAGTVTVSGTSPATCRLMVIDLGPAS